MSCNVLIIPEDPTYNGYILKPLVAKLLKECGKASANVNVLTNPKVAGFEHACRSMPAGTIPGILYDKRFGARRASLKAIGGGKGARR